MCYQNCSYEDYNGDCTAPRNQELPCVVMEREAEEEERRLEMRRAEIRQEAVDRFFDSIQKIRTKYLCSRNHHKEERLFKDIANGAEEAVEDMRWKLMDVGG